VFLRKVTERNIEECSPDPWVRVERPVAVVPTSSSAVDFLVSRMVSFRPDLVAMNYGIGYWVSLGIDT
jgi:hypothetical protein